MSYFHWCSNQGCKRLVFKESLLDHRAFRTEAYDVARSFYTKMFIFESKNCLCSRILDHVLNFDCHVGVPVSKEHYSLTSFCLCTCS